MKTLLRLFCAAAIAGLSLSATAADRPRLFGAAVPAKSAATATANPAAVRERLAAPDFTLIPDLAAKDHRPHRRPAGSRSISSPTWQLDAQVTRVETTHSGGIAIIARHRRTRSFGSAVLVQNGNVMTGSITMPGATYSILPAEPGTVRIAKVNPSLVPPERDPRRRRAPRPWPRTAPGSATRRPTPASSSTSSCSGRRPRRPPPAAPRNIQANIDTAIALTNTSYRNSGIAQRVRLVSKQAATYNETTGDPFGDALNAISGGSVPTAGGSTVGAQRNAFGADEVVMVINDPSFCGLAWLPGTISAGNQNQGFAVVGGGTCLTSNLSFGHELGHNMGAHHDTYVLGNVSTSVCPDGKEKGAFCYSHGFSHIGASSGTSWRTCSRTTTTAPPPSAVARAFNTSPTRW